MNENIRKRTTNYNKIQSKKMSKVTTMKKNKKDTAYIICPKCGFKNRSDASHCDQCGTNLLPPRSIRERKFGFLMLTVGIGLAVILWVLTGGSLLWSILVAFFIIGMIIGGFKLAFGKTLIEERYIKRAERHKKDCPYQALLDLEKAFYATEDPETLYRIYEDRGDIYMKLGRYTDAISQYESFLKKHDPISKEGSSMGWELKSGRVYKKIEEAKEKLESDKK